MNKQEIIEALAKEMSEAEHNMHDRFPPFMFEAEATIAVEMFWPLVEAANNMRNALQYECRPCDENIMLATEDALDKALNNLKEPSHD